MVETKPLDTYFFNADKALEIAKQQNRVETSVKAVDALQLCYYTADEKLSNTPKNCIYVPLEDVFNYFVTTKYRFPKAISFEDSGFSMPEQAELNGAFSQILGEAKNEREKLAREYAQKIFENSPDFSEKPWKVFIPACRETTVMQYVSKNIASTFEELGYEIFYNIQGELEDCSCNLHTLMALSKFKPHITVNVNHLNNTYINKNIFNFSWFQDPMKILYNDESIQLRKNDYVFYLNDIIKKRLLHKNVPNDKLFLQNFATNENLFFIDKNIKKEKKIVFLGSDYNFEKNYNLDDECIKEIYQYLEENTLTENLIINLSKVYGVDIKDFETYIIASLVRRRIIIWLCSLKNINIEVYGTDTWLNTPEVVPFYKGLLPYGREMAKVYNSAEYAIVAHPQYRYQQRLIEISACGTIPIVYKGKLLKDDFLHEDNVLSFSTFKELKSCVGKIPKKDSIQISRDISYKRMVKKIVEIVSNNVKETINVR